MEYTRCLSGSGSRNSFNEDAWEQMEFNVNDISRASSPASVVSISARSEGHGAAFRERRHRNLGRADDEYRRKYSKIKAELEFERMKARQLQQEKIDEMRRFKEAYEKDRKLEIAALQHCMEEDKKKEVARLMKEKDFELQQVLMYKESERKYRQTLERKVMKEKDNERVQMKEKDAAVEEEEELIRGKDGDNDVASGTEIGHWAQDFDGGTYEVKQGSNVKNSWGTDKENYVSGSRARVDKSDVSPGLENLLPEAVSKENINKDGPVSSNTKEGISSKEEQGSAQAQLRKKEIESQPKTGKKDVRDDCGTEQNVLVRRKDCKRQDKELVLPKSENQKQKEALERLLQRTTKEHKEEFLRLKAGYERELQTVIYEHKKVALANLQKLQQAEATLRETTQSDKDMTPLSEKPHRRLSLSALELELSKMELLAERPREETKLKSINEDYRERSVHHVHINTKQEEREKEKNLQKKLGELTSQIQRLERRIALLKTENDTLRKKQDEQRPLEEKIKSLKKRNAELAAIARRLEDKAKALQLENSKVRSKNSLSPNDEASSDVEHLKRLFGRQRAKDLAEHAKTMLGKDKEIEELRRKCQQLADQLSNGDLMVPQNAGQFVEKEELVNIIKQAAKERLQLEHQLTHSKNPVQQVTDEKYREDLESANQILHKEIVRLEEALHKAGTLEQQLTEKCGECNSLRQELNRTKQRQELLQSQLSTATLHEEQLKQSLTKSQQISEECTNLKVSLATAQKEREAAQEEIRHLNLRVHSLEYLVRDLQESSEHGSQLDREHTLVLQELEKKQVQLEHLQQLKSSIESEHVRTVSELNQQVQELEEKRQKEEKRSQELARELERLQEGLVRNQQAIHCTEDKEEAGEAKLRSRIFKEEMERKALNQNDRPVGESFLSAWAQKGPIQVYIAKYNYDPFEFSPNENPEAELPLTAGDYVLVVGEMDEDGFFDGELIDGRQGLVPSNFIQKVEDEDLVEFHTALMQAGHSTPTIPTSAVAATSSMSRNYMNNNNEPGFLSGETDNNMPPCPRSLSLDRQLSNSFLVSWRGPDPVAGLEVQSYHVMVDSQLRTTVKGNERTKALLEGINANATHRICVRCLSNKGQSKDAQCTMLVGPDVYPVPSELKVTHVSSTSASLSWLPGNSNYQHSIIVNGKEVRVVKPGVFWHTITMLTPGSVHKVTLIAKSISGVLNEERSRKWVENVSASLEFRTPEAGSPEPPLNVQVESGPREGTLLVTWLPVTINSSGICNGAVIAGYNVMIDGRKIKHVLGPTSDHLVLTAGELKGVTPTPVSVRTVSTSGMESGDSELVHVPSVLIQEVTEGVVKISEKVAKSAGSEDDRGHETDEEIEAAFAEAELLNDGVNAIMTQPYSDSSSSELSDIPEVEEDLIGSQDSHLNLVGADLTNQMSSPSQAEKLSPQPAPRKLAASIGLDSGAKVIGNGGNVLAGAARMVPAIEITRDSSTERGTSLDEETEDGGTPTSVFGKGHAPDAVISSHYRGDVQNPSAFRQVDQTGQQRNSGEAVWLAGIDTEACETSDQYGKSHGKKALNSYDSKSQSPKHQQSADTTHSLDHRKLASPETGLVLDAAENDSISGEINPVLDASTVRLFIALFDYDPASMSPNVDCIDEELPFREGQILKVFGDKDADGFYKGESHGRTGYIPCNMVSEVHIDDPELVEQLLQETAHQSDPTHKVTSGPVVKEDQLTPNGVSSVGRGSIRKMIAMYDYDPQELSPNVDVELELSFKTGDIVMVYGDMDEDGFFMGEIDGQRGLVPSNFLQPAPLSDDEGLESVSLVSATRSRSGESLDVAVNAAGRMDTTTNVTKLGEQLLSSLETSSSNKQAVSVNLSEGSRPGTASPADEEKPKKKGGFLNKSKNILKKLTR